MNPDQPEHPDEGAYDTIYDMIIFRFPMLKADKHEDGLMQLTTDFLELIKKAEEFAAMDAISDERERLFLMGQKQ